jgi:4-amino-4-deoxy-L-arabinose transferase-like glycosyltransferase
MKKDNQYKEKEKLTVFDKIVEYIGWIQIVLSPLLIALLIATPFYLSKQTKERLFISFLIVFTGLLIGIIFATKILKTRGTINFLSNMPENITTEKEEKD